MTDYTVSYTELEELGMIYVCANTELWVANACKERARLAVEEAFTDAVNAFVSRGEVMPGTMEEITKLAFEKGYLIPYKDRVPDIVTPVQP